VGILTLGRRLSIFTAEHAEIADLSNDFLGVLCVLGGESFSPMENRAMLPRSP